jgi:hypothetical protein
MHNVDLQLEGIEQARLEEILAEASVSPDAYEVSTASRTSGNWVVDLVVELAHTDLNALSLVIGYLMGTGVALFYMVGGVRKKISLVSDAMKLLDQSRKQDQATGTDEPSF